MNKKLVLSVLSTAVVASMAASAMAKPNAGFYVGGNVDKYYSIDAFLNHLDTALDEIIDNLDSTTFVDENGKAAPFLSALNAQTEEELNAVTEPARLDHFENNPYAIVDGTGVYNPEEDEDLLAPEPGELKVESVSAINANEIKVVFGKEVFKESAETESNYSITLNGAPFNPAGLTATLLDDKKTVILSNVNAGVQQQIFSNGDSFRVTVDGVMDKDYNKFPKFTSELAAYNDVTAPTVVKSELRGSTIRVYFSEPVTGGTIKVDNGTAVAPASYVNGGGVYYVTLNATAAQQAAGTHTVTVYNFQDAEGNTLPVATTTYTAAADTTAPSVQSITAESAYTFKVKVSEPLAAEPTIEVKKGNLVLPLDNTFGGGNGIALDTTDTTNTTYIVKVADANASNPVYGTGETSVNLSVKVSDLKDNANLVGAVFNGTVTLSKDATAPTVVNANLNTADTANNYLYVRFNEDLDASYSTDGALDSKIVVTKNGVQLPVTAASVQNDANGDPTLVRVTLGSVTPGTYNVKFLAGAVTDVDANANAEVSTTVTVADPTALVTPSVSQPAANVIQITFGGGVDMTDSATNLANYTLDGQAFPAGTTIGFYNNKQTVRITLPSNLYSQNTVAQLKISKNVKNENNVPVLASASPETEYTTQINITDNVKPVLESAKFLVTSNSATTSNKVKLTFSEDLGTAPAADDLKVTVNGNEVAVSNIALNGDVVTFNIPTTVISQGAQVKVLPASEQTDGSMDAEDLAGNDLTEGTIVTATEKELDTDAIASDAAAVAADKAALAVNYNGTDATINLTTTGTNGSTITWADTTDAANVATVTGGTVAITRSAADDTDDTVVLTATITKGTASDTATFTITVKEAKAAVFASGEPTAVTGASTGDLDVTADLDENGTVYYVVVPAGDAAPTAAEVVAGTASGGATAVASGQLSVTAGTQATATESGITAGSYDVYFVAEDANGNVQNTVTSVTGVAVN
ncbi:immunoglobulin-like domain-containing protein [Brevibacillus thermoruber]|uniref:immunoglobulin-like domain-containing protein n=1 Tax=Brevibacillus thermoruber TaxID=33942 RepID=UPI00048DB5FA|nr:immunoglobulin-like domain-containing protein [Brevibacillus thermoruber]